MSLVDVKVELGLYATAETGRFILDDDVTGVLGVSSLSGLTFTDVSDHVKSVSVTRGRSRQLDNFNAGSAVVTFDNRGRAFDPINEDSPFYPGIEPRGIINITAAGFPVFYGFINDWDSEYDLAGNDTASASCSDSFMVLSNQVLSAFTPSEQLTGARINTVLSRSEVDFVGGRDIDAGNSTLGAFAVNANTNVLNYLRQVERSEIGNLFVSASGDVVFRDRSNAPNEDLLEFSDDGSGISYRSLTNQYGDELLYNFVRATSPAGAEQTKSDSDSIFKYQVSQLVYNDLLNSSTTQVADIAQFVLTKFKDPKVRFTGLDVQLVGLSDENRNAVLGLDLIDFVNVKKSFASGTPASLTQIVIVTGISHSVSPDSHTVSFAFESTQDALLLVLGSSIAGKLDSGILDF
jgi:hypothetical protein